MANPGGGCCEGAAAAAASSTTEITLSDCKDDCVGAVKLMAAGTVTEANKSESGCCSGTTSTFFILKIFSWDLSSNNEPRSYISKERAVI